MITELGYHRNVVHPSYTVTFPNQSGGPDHVIQVIRNRSQLSWEVGGMVNRGKRSAIGGTLLLSATDRSVNSIGLKGRYRRWLTPEGIALDFGAGLELQPDETFLATGDVLGFTGDVAINASAYVAVVTRLDVARMQGKMRPAVSLGLRAGSKPALVATGAVAIAYGLIYSVFGFWNE